MHYSSTLFLVALASLMVSFTSAKGASERNAVRVNNFRRGNKALHANKRRLMDKRKTTANTDPYVDPYYNSAVQPQGTSGGSGLTGGLTDGLLGGGGGGGGGGATGTLPLVGDLI